MVAVRVQLGAALHRIGLSAWGTTGHCLQLKQEKSMRKHRFLIAVIMFGLTWAGISTAEDQPIEQQLVDAMNKVFGALGPVAIMECFGLHD
jgi:hypothetical protein